MELEEIPEHWVDYMELMDEIWVPNDFHARVLAQRRRERLAHLRVERLQRERALRACRGRGL